MLKVGIVGSGFGLYGLLPAFNSTKKCKVVSICGKKTERLTSYCRKIGLKNIYTDWRVMLDNENLDAVAVAVIPGAQYEIAKEAISKGINIFAEKPLALNYKQAYELFILAEKKKIIHMIDFIFPEIDAWQKVKQMLDKNAFGKLEHVSVNWDFESYDIRNNISSWKTNVKEGGGALSFYFSHSLYYLEYYAGEILDVKSIFSYSKESINGGETGVDLLLNFKNRVSGYAHICCNSKGLQRHQLIFQCEKGLIILGNENSMADNFYIKTYNQKGIGGVGSFKSANNEENLDERVKIVKKLSSRFVNSCLSNKQAMPSFKEGARVQKLIEIIRSK